MKKIFGILALCLLFSVACQQGESGNEQLVNKNASIKYTVDNIADHNVVIVQPVDVDITAPVVIVVADDIKLATRAAEAPEINFKAAEHCLIGRYILCVVEAGDTTDVSYLTVVKGAFPNASKYYMLSYRNGVAYTAAMQMPRSFNAYACVSGAIDVESYKVNSFSRPVSFVHVHAVNNAEYKWNGVENKSVSVPLSIGAVVAINECTHYTTSEFSPREGKGRVKCTQYLGGATGTDVKLYSVESDNSGWCDEEFEVYNQVWNFFKTH